MGKGGGGGPTQSTAYQTNLPEYAKPYVMNMLGAAQNQLFTTTPGTDGEPGEITGFRPYTPYSTDPTKYFAGPSSLQQSTYGEAGGMQTPGQYGMATGLGGLAAMGQMGAGQRFSQQARDPFAVQQYMSPFMQNVVDTQKLAALRDFQVAQPARQAQATRAGAFGGSRQAIENSEAQRNLMSQLQGIQAQGTQKAFEDAQRQQQFGANLGLQGLAGASQTAGMLGQLGGAQQQADLARMGFQNQLGQQQQQFQQGIINQAIQDYATQQQYPFMQLSTMSNLLRGLPMQGMTTQQYQAQPSALQQGIGLLGTGASLYGAMKREGGAIKEYAGGGEVKGLGYANRGQVDSMRDRLEEMFAQNEEDTSKYVSQSSSPMVKKLARELGIGGASTGKLGTNMAGGGIIAFDVGGGVFDQTATEEQERYAERIANEKIARERKQKEAFLAENAPEALAAMREREANPKTVFTESSFKDFDKAQALFEKERYGDNTPPPPPAPPAANLNQSTPGSQAVGLAAQLALREKFLGERGAGGAMGEEARGLMDYIKEGKDRRQSEAGRDRYLRMAEAFSQFGSTAGPFAASASKALGTFAKGEAGAKKELRAADFADKKMAAEFEKGQRLEARGDFDAAQKAYDNAEILRERRESSIRSAEATLTAANRPGERERIAKQLIEQNPKMTMEQAISRATELMTTSDESKQADLIKSAYTEASKSIAPGGANYKKYKELQEKDPEAAKQFVTELAQRQYQGMRNAMSTITGAPAGSNVQLNKDQQALLDKYK
jgi:hypothetical protein